MYISSSMLVKWVVQIFSVIIDFDLLGPSVWEQDVKNSHLDSIFVNLSLQMDQFLFYVFWSHTIRYIQI